MKESEAIELFKERLVFIKEHYSEEVKCYEEALEIGIQALEEVQQYRAIGTPEGCREWKEKQSAKKVISFNYNNGTVNYGCPVCKRKIISKIDGEWCGGTFDEYCDRCGQKIDWSDEE